jgi:hypothetical protein
MLSIPIQDMVQHLGMAMTFIYLTTPIVTPVVIQIMAIVHTICLLVQVKVIQYLQMEITTSKLLKSKYI